MSYLSLVEALQSMLLVTLASSFVRLQKTSIGKLEIGEDPAVGVDLRLGEREEDNRGDKHTDKESGDRNVSMRQAHALRERTRNETVNETHCVLWKGVS